MSVMGIMAKDAAINFRSASKVLSLSFVLLPSAIHVPFPVTIDQHKCSVKARNHPEAQ